MRSIEFLELLKNKEFFKKFEEENPDSYLCGVFCILNKEEKEGDKVSFNFFIPSKKQVALMESPYMDVCISKEEREFKRLEDLDKIKVDLLDLWDIVEDAKKNIKLNSEIGKIIAFLNFENWDLTCFTSALDIIKIKIDSHTGKTLDVSKKSLFDSIAIQKK
jgi:hypothetical protein